MKKLIALLALGCALVAHAAPGDLQIERVPLGSGLQNARGLENAKQVGDYGVYHAPQYMPGHPTAATIWPRVVEVRCVADKCEGYESSPGLGRGEYLFFKPVQVVEAPVRERIIERPVVVPPPVLEKKINQ